MTFIWPIMLSLLMLVPLAVLLYLYLQRRRRRLAELYGQFGQANGAALGVGTGNTPGLRRHLPPALFLLGLIILIIALARPQTTVVVPSIEGTVMLAFDVSGSMAAEDLQPNRMEAARAAALDFVRRQPPSVKVGVIAFSDNGFSVQAPTDDQAALLNAINRLTPQRGTSLGNGILASLNTLEADRQGAGGADAAPAADDGPPPTPTAVPHGAYRSAVIVLLTDGENLEAPDPLEAAQTAADRGVRIYTVGIGSKAGTTIEVEGFTVHTRLDEAMLQQIAQISGGAYYSAETEQDFYHVYEDLNRQLVTREEHIEVTAIFAGVGVLFLILGGLLSLLWFSRVP